jgi:hypothetical protein
MRTLGHQFSRKELSKTSHQQWIKWLLKRLSLPEICKQNYTNCVVSKYPYNLKISDSGRHRALPYCLLSFLVNERDGKITDINPREFFSRTQKAINRQAKGRQWESCRAWRKNRISLEE